MWWEVLCVVWGESVSGIGVIGAGWGELVWMEGGCSVVVSGLGGLQVVGSGIVGSLGVCWLCVEVGWWEWVRWCEAAGVSDVCLCCLDCLGGVLLGCFWCVLGW